MHQPPCRGCMERYQGCHGDCEAYQTFHAEQQAISDARNKENHLYDYGYISHTRVIRYLNRKARA